ncbi:iron ABC transporter permease [Exiguobacterium acetylicum]|uniref:FecCD family ABC transporter permease n=1 Tax=Exiguobacterium TaxID=33986 RepID=UPI00044B22DD|nr:MULTISPECIES: iron ABC transporter permease [Exiguobacterium]EZP59825.1 Ferrichrome ABC transporter permease [Exiguobacterium sp. RIT341]KQS37360.1 iron ABC transporter [Exiguobacterium sp. Leaf196]MDQ6467995.1 iron ABC transporter permease [Exiguobacterium acetylicum]HAB34113.1 iron ABC transporter permease [Exiguobacterium sp.]HAZ39677.1 iron ABC transporter permease [Exiguobacterium sp.]
MSAGRIPFGIKITLGLVLFFGMFWIAMTFGAADTTIREVWNALTFGPLNEKAKIVQEIRLPRELAAILVGAALGVSGAIMQAMTRNPLADPGLLGLTAGANAALALVIVLFPKIEYFGIMIACFFGAALGAALVFGIGASKKGGFSPLRIVLAGSAISAFLYAIAEGIGIYFKIAQDVSQWTSGGLVGSTWGQLQVITPVIAIGIVIAFIFSRQLTILSLSEEVALGLGQNIQRIKAVLYVVVILLAGAAVALVGNMAFIGLMIPHIVRAIVGTDYRFILPMTAIFGATFMLLADTIGRTLYAPYETPVIAIVSMLGLPFFLLIVRKGGRAFS